MNRRWQRWNVRPATRSLASRPRRARYTFDDLSSSIDTSMDAGEIMGRRWGQRDAMRELARLSDDELREMRDRAVDDMLRDVVDADHLLDVAEAAGVTPIDPATIDADDLTDDIEAYLRHLDDGAA